MITIKSLLNCFSIISTTEYVLCTYHIGIIITDLRDGVYVVYSIVTLINNGQSYMDRYSDFADRSMVLIIKVFMFSAPSLMS